MEVAWIKLGLQYGLRAYIMYCVGMRVIVCYKIIVTALCKQTRQLCALLWGICAALTIQMIYSYVKYPLGRSLPACLANLAEVNFVVKKFLCLNYLMI